MLIIMLLDLYCIANNMLLVAGFVCIADIMLLDLYVLLISCC